MVGVGEKMITHDKNNSEQKSFLRIIVAPVVFIPRFNG